MSPRDSRLSRTTLLPLLSSDSTGKDAVDYQGCADTGWRSQKCQFIWSFHGAVTGRQNGESGVERSPF